MKCLEQVFVDLTGPMSVASRAGNVYSMNIIDDFSGYVWLLPLKLKAAAFAVLRNWHKSITNQSGHYLGKLVSDNRELVSDASHAWCLAEGIKHQLTAPYMSAQNGRAKCLHQTINAKACTMHLSCNAPMALWDKFISTAMYLTNLTATSANNGKTPFELWFGCKPCLSHLCEIGCHTFALVTSTPPKLHT